MKTVLVSGANRGIGLEIARQLTEQGALVYQGYRKTRPEPANDKTIPLKLDITSDESVAQAIEQIRINSGSLDVLVNNAAIISPTEFPDFDTLKNVLDSNLYGAMRLSLAALPMLEAAKGKIINVSSGMGSSKDLVAGYLPYRLSKYALNGFTQLMHAEWQGRIEVFSMCPGWVRTDMGGEAAPRTVQQGADTAVWLALTNDAESGKFYRDRSEISF